MVDDEPSLNHINDPKITPGVVTTSVNISNNLVTHDEAFEFSENYHTGWEEIEQYWNNIAGLGIGAIIVGIILGFLGLAMSNLSLILAAGLLVVGGIAAISYAMERLKFVKTGKEYMLKANIRIRSK